MSVLGAQFPVLMSAVARWRDSLCTACRTPARRASEGWSGRRGSNPRPTAWKAVTLPLSYSRLRVSRTLFRSSLRRVHPPLSLSLSKPTFSTTSSPTRGVPAVARSPSGEKDGGEGRTRTFEAARATDLQSAAFDRFATSPASCVVENAVFSVVPNRPKNGLACPKSHPRRPMELAEGFEPPTG
jgi:hypothetical protein